MENITTKLKTRFSGDGGIEADNDSSISHAAAARKILRFVFKTPKRSMFVLLFVLLSVGILVFGGYHLFNKSTPQERAKQELAAAVASVGKLMILPKGDEPVLATVTDAETLIKQQAFFAGSINGDQLLLFPRNLKAVIYSPSRRMIVNVGPIQQQPQVAENTQIPNSKSQPISNDQNSNVPNGAVLTVEIRNGTSKNGLASQIAEQVSGNAGYKVLKVTDAHKRDYSETLVVNKNRDVKKLQLANSLIATLGGRTVSELPSGEKDTDADVLIILGGK